jgi:hypothetical protein
MKLRFFLDEDVHMALAVVLRKRGRDAVHALEGKRLGLADESQLTFAAKEGALPYHLERGRLCSIAQSLGCGRPRTRGNQGVETIASARIAASPVGLLGKEDSESLRGQIRFL